MWNRSSDPVKLDEPLVDWQTALRAVKTTSAQHERARLVRDNTIRRARASRVKQEEVAAAAGLSVSRIKQIAKEPLEPTGAATPETTRARKRPEETEKALWVATVPGVDVGVYTIENLSAALVEPLQRWDTERAFLMALPEREYAIDCLSFKDSLTDQASWSVKRSGATGEVYAYRHARPGIANVADGTQDQMRMPMDDQNDDNGPQRGDHGWQGDILGPCYLLGAIHHEQVYRVVLGKGGLRSLPGGVAWAYGQLQLAMEALDAAAQAAQLSQE